MTVYFSPNLQVIIVKDKKVKKAIGSMIPFPQINFGWNKGTRN